MWRTIKTEVRSFIHDDEPELIHIIKTGFDDHYIVVWEDAYDHHTGDVEILNAEQIKTKFKIDIDETIS